MKEYILECCVDSVESARNAVRGGANRLELCGNLIIGGTTPSFALFEQVRKETDVKIHVLIRSRFGDFCYTESELKIMKREIEWFRDNGADGIVIGVLKPDGTLDVEAMKYLMEPLQEEKGREMKVTLHRAFDMCKNPEETLEQAVELGIDTILTSGQQESAWKGRELLKKLKEQAAGRIKILAGGGISAEIIRELYPLTQLTDYHMSGKVTLNSQMEYRKEEVSMGLPSLSEYDIWQTKEEKVQAAKSVLEEQAALRYLYRVMPVSDIANYPLETIADFAAHGAYIWEHGEFAGMVPEDIFKNYVLYHRVNDEEIEPCRTFFYSKVQKIIQGKTMEEAAKEINYWCAGEAAYHTEDDRTASAMSVYRAGEGRCGEESVFVVNVLRSAGIPARQVYSPYWSHCDDNHAWVEVWIDGKWHFLGACEPEEVLDRGWFVSAASRAMMVHTPLFDETLISTKTAGREKKAVLLNELHRYAETVTLHVTVRDFDGQAVPKAYIRCLVMNYASLLEVANGMTDEEGQFSLETGKGSLYIEVSADGKMGGTSLFGGKLVNLEEESECTIQISEVPWNFDVWEEMEFYAPKDACRHGAEMTSEQKLLAKEKAEQAVKHLEKKREEIKMICGGEGLEKRLIEILTVKDLRETDLEFIKKQAAFAQACEGKYPEEIFIPYLLQPRIGLERMTLLHEELGEIIGEEKKNYLEEHLDEVRSFVEERVLDSGLDDYKELLTTPASCIRAGVGSKESKEILIAAIYRILGVPSRLSAVDQVAEYYMDGRFQRTDDIRTGKIFIGISETDNDKWNYREDYSVALLKNNKFIPCKEVPTGEEIEVPEGIYRICTANRLPNGNVYAKICYKKVTETLEKVILEKKPAKLSEMLSQNPIPEIRLKTFEGKEICLSDAGIYIWAEPGQEPTEHIFNELIEKAEQFQNTNIVIITKTEKECSQKTYKRLREMLHNNVQSFQETDSEQPSLIARKMYDEPEKFPFILVLQQGLVGIYAASGYNVGTADMLLRMIEGNLLK